MVCFVCLSFVCLFVRVGVCGGGLDVCVGGGGVRACVCDLSY